jgi:hypothetical protein
MIFNFGINYIYGDPYSFDKYSAKLEAPLSLINPKKLTDFFDWFIRKINRRMIDIVRIEEAEKKEKLVMTLNRAIFDAQMAIVSEIPYTSKLYFFSLVDKLANIESQLKDFKRMDGKERKYWKKLVSIQFIQNDLKDNLKRVPGETGNYYQSVLLKLNEQLKKEGHTEQDFLDMRDSLHGYGINAWKRMIKKNGILNNNFVLLSAPLIFNLVYRPLRYL